MIRKTSRQQYSKDERDQYLRLWRQGDFTQKEFCKQQSLPIKTFGKWVRESQPKRLKLLPVLANETEAPQESQPIIDIMFPSGVRCQFKSGSTKDIIQLIQEYERCS